MYFAEQVDDCFPLPTERLPPQSYTLLKLLLPDLLFPCYCEPCTGITLHKERLRPFIREFELPIFC